MMATPKAISRKTTDLGSDYKWGFVTDIQSDVAPKGLNEDIIRLISGKKNEPAWMLDWRLRAYRHWTKVSHEKLRGVPWDAVFDSVSVATTLQETLNKLGIIFCSFSEAVQKHPDLVRKYLGSVVPHTDNFFASLNSAVFSDGSFAYVPPGGRCPVELMTYFRINTEGTGQFERTLIIADKGSYVSYLEGGTAPMRKSHQLHAAVVELIALDDAETKYSTLQNWYPGA